MQGYPYRDIHPTGNSIVLDGGEDRRSDTRDGSFYENAVFDILEHITYRSGSRVGNLIIMGVLSHASGVAGRGVRIFTSRRPIANAITTPLDRSSDPAAQGSNFLFRRGGGAQSTIAYFPFEWPVIGSGPPGQAQDEILLHEMIHVYMIQRGLSSVQGLRVAGRPHRARVFDIVDDFFTVMLTNVYASERGRPLRSDHSVDSPRLNRTAEQVGNDEAFAQFFQSLERALPDLVRELQQIDTPFNPWRVRNALP